MGYRRKIVAGNWKMNKTATEAKEFVSDMIEALGQFSESDVEIVICPPFIALSKCVEAMEGTSVMQLGAQDMHAERSGAYTGEISAEMLKDLFCRYVILGHSERRQYNGENDEQVNTKTKAAIANKIKPIVCVGETLEQREANRTKTVITTQVTNSLAQLSTEEWSDVVIAYEPVWAIGTGKTATPEQAQEVHKQIRGLVAKNADDAVAEKIRILYGGSVKPGNAEELMSQDDIDGALVGGASLDCESFTAIVEAACGDA
ncbi:MAG: triose-phosphate isomerase [Verrucomicrobiota bacterium]